MSENANITLPLAELERRFKVLAQKLPRIAGNEVVNFALDNFRLQGFMGDTFQPWRKRKNPNKWGQSPKRNGRNILIDSGRLRRSPRVVSASWDRTVIGSDVPYAKAHNDGSKLGVIQQVNAHRRNIKTVAKISSLKTKKTSKKTTHAMWVDVKEHKRRINQNLPARPFLKDSPYLRRRLQRTISAEILKTLK